MKKINKIVSTIIIISLVVLCFIDIYLAPIIITPFTLMDAFYFTIITIATGGYGDVPYTSLPLAFGLMAMFEAIAFLIILTVTAIIFVLMKKFKKKQILFQ